MLAEQLFVHRVILRIVTRSENYRLSAKAAASLAQRPMRQCRATFRFLSDSKPRGSSRIVGIAEYRRPFLSGIAASVSGESLI
jgi:hypothetical protein